MGTTDPTRGTGSSLGIWIREYAREHVQINSWLYRFDPEHEDGLGLADFTDDPALAMRFASRGDAMALIATVPKSRPLRADGEPNCPLRAFTLEIRPLPD